VKIKQIREYSRESLKGRRAEAFMISLCIPAVIIFFRMTELCTASVVLYLSNMSPMKLFYGSEIYWIIFDLICIFLKIIIFSTIVPAIIKYFSNLLDIKLPEQKSRNLFKKNFILNIIIKAVSLIFLMPAVLFGYLSANLILSEKSESVFLIIHTVTLTLVSLLIFMWIVLGMSALPFLVSRYSGNKIFRLIFISFKIMKHARGGLIKIILFYFSTILIPFLSLYTLPEFFSSLTLYINICIKEVEYIGGENLYSKKSKAHDAAKISDRKKRRIKASPDKA